MKPLTALQLLAVLIMSSLTSLSLRAGTLLISCNTPIALLDPASELKALVTADGTSLTTGLRFTRLRAVYPFSDLPLHLYTIEYDEQTDGDQLQADLLQSAAVIRATPNHRFRCQQLEEDPLRAWQWGLERVEAPSAWVEADGNGVVLAVIDTGIDWTHPDLQENIWFNLGEDNGNGTPFQYDPEEGWLLDPQDANGIDDDGNGLVDDVIGFDFTDAPEFPAPGDYLEPDRDPADEHRHGTIVASVAGAVTGNSIGIAAVAPGVTVMPLRAGNSLGFLQEDDVAAAIIYATLNGAQVINMSFGDTEVAPILHDVIQYASSRGVVMVASTGNDGSSQLHFPSAWPEVISVGAVTSAGYRWQLSNYGLNLDLVAPGDSILAAIPGAGYAAFSGTSLAAPFVSGAVAILLDAVPTRTPTLLKNILRTSAVDIGPPGYDNEYGAGILNIPAALATPVTTVVSIAEPAAGSRWQPARQALLEISGSAAGNFFASWLLQLGTGDNPHDWTTVASSVYQQLAGPLALIDLTTLADTSYTLKLEVQQLDGSTLPAFSSFTVDRTPPEIVALSSLRAVQASSLGRVFEIELTDPVTVELHYAPAGSQQYHRLVSPFTSTEHCLTLLQSLQSGLTDLFFQAISSSGDSTRSPLLICELPTAWYPRPLHSRPANLPYGLLLNRVTDFNQNSHPEVWLTAYDPLTHFPDLLQLQEYDPAGDDFVQLPATWGTAYIKDLGDIDGDGTLELLSEIGGISYLFTQTNLLQPPDQLAWRSESHWAGNFITPGPVDNGYPNVLLRSGGSPRHYLAARFSSIGDSSTTVMTTLDTLFNPFYSPTEPFATGVARGVEGDFDNDSNVDLLLSDNEGHIFIYEYSGPQPQLIWQHEEPGWRGPGNMIAAGNFSQTDYEEFIVVWRTATPQSEHEVAAGRWLVAWYDYATSNDWRLRDTIAVIGMYHGETRENGIAVGDIDGDGLAEIILTLFPDMYLFDICDGRLVPIAWQGGTNLPGNLICDFDGDGIVEWLAGNEQAMVRLQLDDLNPLQAPAPVALSGYSDTATSLLLTWQYSGTAAAFMLHYRQGDQETVSVLPGDLRVTRISPLLTDSTYTISLRTIDPVYPQDTSRFSETVSLTPNLAPWIVTINQEAPHFLRIRFSEAMADDFTAVTRYLFQSAGVSRYPSSVLAWAGNREALVTVDLDDGAGTVYLQPDDLRDASATPLDSNASQLTFNWQVLDEELFFLRRGYITDHDQFRLQFNRPVGSSIEQAENYRFQPGYYHVIEVTICDSLRMEFEITVESHVPLGAYGRQLLLQLEEICSLDSIALAPETSSLLLQTAAADLSGAFIYPNPWRLGVNAGGVEGVMIAGLPAVCDILIYDLSGRLLTQLLENDGDGGYRWNGSIADGFVTTGIYIVMLRQGEQIVRRKLAVIE